MRKGGRLLKKLAGAVDARDVVASMGLASLVGGLALVSMAAALIILGMALLLLTIAVPLVLNLSQALKGQAVERGQRRQN